MNYSVDPINQPNNTRKDVVSKCGKQLLISAYPAKKRLLPKRAVFVALSGIVVATSCLVVLLNLVPSNTSGEAQAQNNDKDPIINSTEHINRIDRISVIPELIKPMTRQEAAEEKARIEKAAIAAQIVLEATKSTSFDEIYTKAEKKFGVSRYILAAIHYVETGQSGDTDRKSSAGAVGPMQFMSETFDAYAVDGDSDGVKSITDVDDAIFSAAKNLAANGANDGKMPAALHNYNHSDAYVKQVLSIAKGFGYTE